MRWPILFVAVLAAGCSRTTTPPVTVAARVTAAPIRKLAVMPVEVSATTIGNAAARAPAAVTDMMSAAAAQQGGWTLIPPAAVQAALEKIEPTEGIEAKAGALAGRVGADATLTATVAEYSERQGGNYGVMAPASVSIQFVAVWAGQKKADWKADYTTTQEPLAYNLWNLGGFVQSGGKWLTVNELARIGIDEAVKRLAERSAGS